MESPDNMNPNEPVGGDPVPSPATSKLGMIGLALGVLGMIVYCSPLAIAFAMGMSGGADAIGTTGVAALSIASYCGLFVSIIGGILGVVSLMRGENKTYGIISIVLGVLMLCTCSALAIYGASAAS